MPTIAIGSSVRPAVAAAGRDRLGRAAEQLGAAGSAASAAGVG